MQPIDLTKFNNPSNWQVIHDPSDNLYYIKSDKGHYLQGSFTDRTFAERKLFSYLDAAKTALDKQNAKAK